MGNVIKKESTEQEVDQALLLESLIKLEKRQKKKEADLELKNKQIEYMNTLYKPEIPYYGYIRIGETFVEISANENPLKKAKTKKPFSTKRLFIGCSDEINTILKDYKYDHEIKFVHRKSDHSTYLMFSEENINDIVEKYKFVEIELKFNKTDF